MKNIICSIFGHKWVDEGEHYILSNRYAPFNLFKCSRCGKVEYRDKYPPEHVNCRCSLIPIIKEEEGMFKLSLGQEVKDKVTGFTGVVVCRTEYMTGCNRVSIQSKKLGKDGKPTEWVAFDEDQLVDLKKNVKHEVKSPGGPQQGEHLLQR